MTDAPEKTCRTCRRSLPLLAFDGRQARCRDCAIQARREWEASKPGAAEKRVRKPRVEHTEALAQQVLD
jgi:hypothetical protein